MQCFLPPLLSAPIRPDRVDQLSIFCRTAITENIKQKNQRHKCWYNSTTKCEHLKSCLRDSKMKYFYFYFTLREWSQRRWRPASMSLHLCLWFTAGNELAQSTLLRPVLPGRDGIKVKSNFNSHRRYGWRKMYAERKQRQWYRVKRHNESENIREQHKPSVHD